MRAVAIAFVAGIIVGAGVVWMMRDARAPVVSASNGGKVEAPSTEEHRGVMSSRGAEAGPANETSTRAPADQVVKVTPPKAAPPASGPDVAPGATAAILIAPGFEQILEPAPSADSERFPSRIALQHLALIAERRDDPWATESEGKIREYVESQLDAAGLDRSAIQLHVIECRETLCEVQATGIPENVGKPDRDPQLMAIGLARGQHASSFANPSVSLTMLPGDRVGYVLFLERKKP